MTDNPETPPMTSDVKIPDYQRIWLQPFVGDEGGHTWCSERIEDDDIEYIRLDLHEAALLAAEQRGLEKAAALVERAFRDGLAYGSNTENADPDLAWRHSRARAAIRSLGGEE